MLGEDTPVMAMVMGTIFMVGAVRNPCPLPDDADQIP